MVGDTFRIPTSLTSSFRVPSYTKSDTVRVSSVRSFLPAFFRSGNVTYNYVVVHHQPTQTKKSKRKGCCSLTLVVAGSLTLSSSTIAVVLVANLLPQSHTQRHSRVQQQFVVLLLGFG